MNAPLDGAVPRPGAGHRLRSLVLIACNEVADSARSRRVWVLAALYMLGSIAGTLLFIALVNRIQAEISASTGITLESDRINRLIVNLVSDREVARTLTAIPPLAVFYGWLAMTFTPLLVVLTASARIAEEISVGSIRFVLFRASRREWFFGKFLGQAAQVLGALLLSAMAAWLIGLLRLKSFEAGPTAVHMTAYALKAWLYALPFLCLALAVSQLFSSPYPALGCGLTVLAGVSILGNLLKWLSTRADSGQWQPVWKALLTLFPTHYKPALWWNDAAHLLPAVGVLLLIGAVVLMAGYAHFSRRNI